MKILVLNPNTSAAVTEKREIQAKSWWCSFQCVTRCQIPCRTLAEALHEKQSSFPPTMCRQEWQDSVYIVSVPVLARITSEPRPTPNRCSNWNASKTSYQRKKSQRNAR